MAAHISFGICYVGSCFGTFQDTVGNSLYKALCICDRKTALGRSWKNTADGHVLACIHHMCLKEAYGKNLIDYEIFDCYILMLTQLNNFLFIFQQFTVSVHPVFACIQLY
jgi:hypothetical protein